MKYLLAISLSLAFVLPLNAQPKYIVKWASRLNNGNDDYAQAITLDSENNVYITGYTSINSRVDYLTIKYDSSGNILWMDTLDNSNIDRARDIAVDGNGNVYVTGATLIGTDFSYLTVKYDSGGNIIWMDTLGSGFANAYAIALDRSGNVYVAGFSNDNYLTVKYDSFGNLLWTRTVDNGSYDYAYGIAVDSSDNVYVTGTSQIGGTWYCFTVKYDSAGNILKADTLYNGSTTATAQDIIVDREGNIYIAGYFNNGSNWDYFTVKYDSSWNIVWMDTLDNGYDDYGYAIALDDIENVYVTGYSASNSASASNNYLTVKYDSMGNIICIETLDNGNNDMGYGVAVDTSHNIYVTGASYNGSNFDYLTAKYVRYVDAGIDTIISPDTACIERTYTPEIVIRNYSYEIPLNLDIVATLDSSGIYVYADTQSVINLLPGDSTVIRFSDWLAPSTPMLDLNLLFTILNSDMDSTNDTISKILHVRDLIPPRIDSAVASDGVNVIPGVDNDDYVVLYFSEPVNKITINAENIDSILPLSEGHSWLDGFGLLGDCYWNADGTQLLINFTTQVSPPSIKVGDTIVPDSATITDLYGNPCSSPVEITGTFGNYMDAAIVSILSLSTTVIDSSYTPKVLVKNNSYDKILTFDIAAYIDSSGMYIYGDTQSVSNLLPNDSTVVSFSPWTTPESPINLMLSFSILDTDMNPNNDTISEILHVSSLIPPVIDSAIASDGTNPAPGVDDDDYVILYFSDKTNKPLIDNTNIDNVLSLSSGHSWLDGFGGIGSCVWNPDGTQLLINLSTVNSIPTVMVGDTITPDGTTILDIYGSPYVYPVVIGGAFESSGIKDSNILAKVLLKVSTVNRDGILFYYGIPEKGNYSITLYNIYGRIIKKLEGKESGYHHKRFPNLPPGVYYLRLKQGKEVVNKKVMVIR